MIAYLEGVLAEKKSGAAVIDVHGVGYSTLIPFSTYEKLPQMGQKVKLLTHTYVREDAFILYAFYTSREKELFELLLNVNGIGPKSALGVLSSLSAADFYRYILNEDIDALQKISGIGKKTAERLVMELREKVKKSAEGLASGTFKAGGETPLVEEALSALISLGYERSEAREALQKVSAEKKKLSAEELVKRALGSKGSGKLTAQGTNAR